MVLKIPLLLKIMSREGHRWKDKVSHASQLNIMGKLCKNSQSISRSVLAYHFRNSNPCMVTVFIALSIWKPSTSYRKTWEKMFLYLLVTTRWGEMWQKRLHPKISSKAIIPKGLTSSQEAPPLELSSTSQ